MKKYTVLSMMLMLCGCELVVDVDVPIEKQNMVLSSFFNPDSTWKAKLSLSRHILDEAPYPAVEDALIVLFEGESPVDTLRHDQMGFYDSDEEPVPGKIYSIRVISNDYGVVNASSSCPQTVEAQFSPLQFNGTGEFGNPEYSLTISFKDPPGKNFYQVMAIGEYRYENPYTGQGFVNRSTMHIWSDDDGIDDPEVGNQEGFFFPDVLFDGENFSLNVKMTPNMWGGNANAKYFIYFRQLNEDYYKYKVTSILQSHTASDPFAQPVKVYTNIENGFGIFAGYTQAVLVIEN